MIDGGPLIPVAEIARSLRESLNTDDIDSVYAQTIIESQAELISNRIHPRLIGELITLIAESGVDSMDDLVALDLGPLIPDDDDVLVRFFTMHYRLADNVHADYLGWPENIHLLMQAVMTYAYEYALAVLMRFWPYTEGNDDGSSNE